ncbi:conserved protein of unknown function [Methylococcus capsulatus]|uniref:Dynamin N-terminal domain-containing protein n=1 Tax=Methylococcus capsulatus TaxID=414 RepID=A0AA35UI48_METCP|nr:dynamin family protein [Methylococcus capsulatus]CAI8721264.1 conserved protein of unknown function [Methylococcus capsulatus]
MNAIPRSGIAGEAPATGYADLKSELMSLIDELAEHLPAALRPALALRDKLQAGHFDVLTVGQFKRGKTSLINALLGENLLPTAAVPLTSVVTVLAYGDPPRITVQPLEGSPFDIRPDMLADYITEPGNPGNAKGVREVLIRTSSPLLGNGVRIVDTPGVGSVFRHNTDTAWARLPQCDAALFVLSADQAVSEAELEFLHEVRKYAGRIFFLLNKIDILQEADTAAIEHFSRRVLTEAVGTEVRLFPISAREALMGKAGNDPARLEASRLPVFTAALERFLLEEKGALLLDAAASGLARLTGRLRLETGLERNSLTLPMTELDEKIARFADRRAQAERELRRLDGRLRQEFRLLTEGIFAGDPERRLEDVRSRLGRRFDALVLGQDHRPPKDFDESLENFLRQEVAEAFADWREALEDQGEAAVAQIAETFDREIDETVAELQRFAGDLFQIAAPAAAPETRWPERRRSGIRPAGEPMGLDLITEQALKRAPDLVAPRFRKLKSLAERWARYGIVRRRRRQLTETVEMLTGRIRSDVRRRLEEMREELSARLRQRLEGVADGLDQALTRGAAERSRASDRTGSRIRQLEAQLAWLDGFDERIQFFRKRAAAQRRT